MIPTLQTYRNQLHPWCLVRQLPDLRQAIIARFRRRNDAEAYGRSLQRLTPTIHHLVVFDAPQPDADKLER